MTKTALGVNINLINAPVAELADAPDLGSGIFDVQVQALSGAPIKRLVFSSRFNYSSSDSLSLELFSSDFDFLMLIPAIAPPTISDNIPAATTTLCITNPVVKSD